MLQLIQEAPYMHANGSGYLAEVMRRVSDAYRAQHGADMTFDVVPVRNWHQLLARARTSRWVSYISTHTHTHTHTIQLSLVISSPTDYRLSVKRSISADEVHSTI